MANLHWTNQEDSVVIDAVTNSLEQPFTRWSDLAQQLPGCKRESIRDRWVNQFQILTIFLLVAKMNDLLLWEGHKKLGKIWVKLSRMKSFFNSTRSENQLKNVLHSVSSKYLYPTNLALRTLRCKHSKKIQVKFRNEKYLV